MFFSYPHHRNSRNLLRLALANSAVPAIKGELDPYHPRPGLLDHFHHDPLLCTHACTIRLFRWSLWEKNNTSSWYNFCLFSTKTRILFSYSRRIMTIKMHNVLVYIQDTDLFSKWERSRESPVRFWISSQVCANFLSMFSFTMKFQVK